MESLKLKSQSLSLAIDFDRCSVSGSTVLSISLSIPPPVYQILEATPPDDIPSSGFILPLQCPVPDVCSISAVEVGGLPATFIWDYCPQEFQNSDGDCKLLINLPALALHRAAARPAKQKYGEHKYANGTSSGIVTDGNTTLSLKVSLTFSLSNLTLASSLLYFTIHTTRSQTKENTLVRYPLLVTATKGSRDRAWFPTIPKAVLSQSGRQRKGGARCSWKCQFTVPRGMIAVGSGYLTRRCLHLNSEGKPVETFHYETSGTFIVNSDTPDNEDHSNGEREKDEEKVEGDPSSGKIELPATEERRKRRRSSIESFSTPKRRIRKSSKPTSLSIQTFEGSKLGSPGFPVTTFITLKGFETRLACVAAIAVAALRALRDTFDIDYPHPQLTLLFLPIGISGLCIGSEVWDPGTCLREAIVNSSVGASFCSFGGLVVFDDSILHPVTDNHPRVFQWQEIIAEGILSILFGSVWDVPTCEVTKDYWLLVAFRRMAVDTFIKDTLGQAHSTSMNWLKLELFARLVELGYDTHALSSEVEELCEYGERQPPLENSKPISNNWFSPFSFLFNLKAAYIFPSLEVLLSSPRCAPQRAACNEFDSSCVRWSPPPGSLNHFLALTVQHAYKKGPGHLITSRRLLERVSSMQTLYPDWGRICFICSFLFQLNRRLKQIFISTGTWRALRSATQASGSGTTTSFSTHRPPELPKVPPTVDTLDVAGFASSWIFGVGCASVSIGMFLQLQRKAVSPTIESFTLNYDEHPLQPPCSLDSYSGISETNGASLSAVAAAEALLEAAGTLDPDNDQEDFITENKQRDVQDETLTTEIDSYSLLANQDLFSLLGEYGIELPFMNPTAYELIVKDNGLGLGFGYAGKEATALLSGDGSLFQVIQTRLTADWGSIDSEQKVALTADIPSRLAVLHSNPNDKAKYFPIATLPTYPVWFLSTLVSHILRDLVKYPVHLSRMKAVRTSVAPFLVHLVKNLHGEDLTENETLLHSKADISTPLSVGFGKCFASLVTVHVCTEQSVLQHPKFLQDHELPQTIDVRVVDTSLIRTARSSTTVGPNNSSIIERINTRRFCGTLSAADELLFTNESQTAPDVTSRKIHESTRMRRGKIKHLPILWVRVMGETRPIWLARLFRCQSVGMWEQQLMNDNLTNSKLEAAIAMGSIPSSSVVIPRLAWTLRDHQIHPLIRSFAAQSLQKLHNDGNTYHAPECATALLNYLYTYHYKQEWNSMKHEHQSIAESCKPVQDDANVESIEEEKDYGVDEGTAISPKHPPYWLTSEMIFLQDILTSISKLKGVDKRTPFESLDVLTQPLTHQRTSIRPSEANSADYYSAHLIKSLGNIHIPFTPPRQVIEVVLLPEVLPAFIKASRRPFAIWSRPSYSIRSPALRSDVSEQLINQALQISDLSHHPDSVRDSIEKDFARWRDGVDSDIESIFLHIWRFYRLDSCLHSTKHVITAACLRVFAQCSMYRELARIKYCEELGAQLEFLSFLPLNFTPLLLSLVPWVQDARSASSRSVSAGCLAHTICLSASGAAIARAQVSVVRQLFDQIKEHKEQISTVEKTSYFERLKEYQSISTEIASREAFYAVVLSGVEHLTTQMLSHFLIYSDRSVEKEAIRSLLYCCAIGTVEPPMILLLQHAPQALSDFHSFEDVAEYLEVTFELTRPTDVRYWTIWEDLKLTLFPILKGAGGDPVTHSEQSLSSQQACRFSDSFPLASDSSSINSISMDKATEYVSRCLFNCRWTSYDESIAIRNSGLGILNASLVACRLEELLTGCDAVELLTFIWEAFLEVLYNLVKQCPLALMPFWLKQYRYENKGKHPSSSTSSAQVIVESLKAHTPLLPRVLNPSCCSGRPHRRWEGTLRKDIADDAIGKQTIHKVVRSKKSKKKKRQKSEKAPQTLTTTGRSEARGELQALRVELSRTPAASIVQSNSQMVAIADSSEQKHVQISRSDSTQQSVWARVSSIEGKAPAHGLTPTVFQGVEMTLFRDSPHRQTTAVAATASSAPTPNVASDVFSCLPVQRDTLLKAESSSVLTIQGDELFDGEKKKKRKKERKREKESRRLKFETNWNQDITEVLSQQLSNQQTFNSNQKLSLLPPDVSVEKIPLEASNYGDRGNTFLSATAKPLIETDAVGRDQVSLSVFENNRYSEQVIIGNKLEKEYYSEVEEANRNDNGNVDDDYRFVQPKSADEDLDDFGVWDHNTESQNSRNTHSQVDIPIHNVYMLDRTADGIAQQEDIDSSSHNNEPINRDTSMLDQHIEENDLLGEWNDILNDGRQNHDDNLSQTRNTPPDDALRDVSNIDVEISIPNRISRNCEEETVEKEDETGALKFHKEPIVFASPKESIAESFYLDDKENGVSGDTYDNNSNSNGIHHGSLDNDTIDIETEFFGPPHETTIRNGSNSPDADYFEHFFDDELMNGETGDHVDLAALVDDNQVIDHIFDELSSPIDEATENVVMMGEDADISKGTRPISGVATGHPESEELPTRRIGRELKEELPPIATISDWWNVSMKQQELDIDHWPMMTGTPVEQCAQVLWAYLNSRATRIPAIAEFRLALVRQVYNFLFGCGLPPCIAAQVPPEDVLTPDPFLVDRSLSQLKRGRYLKRLCQFQRRHQDENADVPDWQSVAMEITELLMDLPIAEAFLDKVDLELFPDYRCFEDWKNDLFLMFRNCRIFNTNESVIFRDCEALQNILYSLLRPTERLLRKKEAKLKHKIDPHQSSY